MIPRTALWRTPPAIVNRMQGKYLHPGANDATTLNNGRAGPSTFTIPLIVTEQ